MVQLLILSAFFDFPFEFNDFHDIYLLITVIPFSYIILEQTFMI